MRLSRLSRLSRLIHLIPLLLAALPLALALPAPAAEPANANAGAPLDASVRRDVLEHTLDALEHRYVFPDKAREVAARLRVQARAGAFDDEHDAAGYARRLTAALQTLSQDRHLRVMVHTGPVPAGRALDKPDAAAIEAMQHAERARNFGVERVERLPGNLGLLELRGFAPAEWSGEALSAAMTLLAHTDALIIDLRHNGGGDPAAVALLSSYLFDERTHLNDLYFRPTDRTTQFWTQDWVPGRRFGATKPVFVLTSHRTFSAAEEFSYDLQQLQRATLVGETTGGGAHPGEVVAVGAQFDAFIATGRAINPVSGTNWEGVGVRPDVAVPAADALRTAQLLALRRLLASADDPAALQVRISELEAAPPR